MAENLSEDAKILARLVSLSRNKYFYGKLLTEREMTDEQSYLNRKRWLLNRLGLGSGVLCGLEVEVSQDGSCLKVSPGVAIDPLGREIIVPEACCVQDPRQPTDCLGRPSGKPIKGGGALALCLCYRECEAEPVPVMVSDCDTRQGCAANMLLERYCLRLCQEPAFQPPPFEKACQKIFPLHEQEYNFRQAAESILSGNCPAPASECVVLADVILPEDPKAAIQVDLFAHRSVIFNNVTLFNLIICLAEQAAACCQDRKLLLYVSGDAQSDQAGSTLKDPLVVQVVDPNHNPVGNEPVTFKVRGGGGQVTGAPQTVNSDASGQAKVYWQLGPDPGLNTLEASIAGGANVVFTALAQGKVEKGPVILKTQPANADQLSKDQVSVLQDRGLEIIFDRDMDAATLKNADPWLGFYLVKFIPAPITHVGPATSRVTRVPLAYNDNTGGGPASDVFYQLKEIDLQKYLDQNYRILVLATATGQNIVSAQDKLLLDADFRGAQVNLEEKGLYPNDPNLTMLAALHALAPGATESFPDKLFAGLSSGATTPAIPPGGTGDGTPGGLFQIFYMLP